MSNQLQPLSSKKQAPVDSLRTEMAVIEASQLLGDAGELSILHGDDTYKLTRTKQNKLLLTKCRNEALYGHSRSHSPKTSI